MDIRSELYQEQLKRRAFEPDVLKKDERSDIGTEFVNSDACNEIVRGTERSDIGVKSHLKLEIDQD